MNKLLLAGDKLGVPEMHLRDPKVGTYSACGPFTRHQKRIDEYNKTGDISLLWKNKLDKACFKHDSYYNKYRDVENRKIADGILSKEAAEVMADKSLDGYQRGLASMVSKYFKQSGGSLGEDLSKELHRRVIRKFPRRKVFASGIDDTWSADLVDIPKLVKFNKGHRYMLTVIDVFSKYAWVVPLKSKTAKEVTKAFKKIISESGRKPRNLWTDRGGEFFGREPQKFFRENGINLYATHNKGKAVVVERFNRTLKENMWKYFTKSNTHNYIDVIDQLVSNYNNSIHSAIKMKPTDVNVSNEGDIARIYYDSIKKGKPKLKIGDHVRLSINKGIFEKGYTPNWTEEIFVVLYVDTKYPVAYSVKDLKGNPVKGIFYERELQKTNLTDRFRVEKVIRRKGDRAYVKWKGYPSDFNSWVDVNDSLPIL